MESLENPLFLQNLPPRQINEKWLNLKEGFVSLRAIWHEQLDVGLLGRHSGRGPLYISLRVVQSSRAQHEGKDEGPTLNIILLTFFVYAIVKYVVKLLKFMLSPLLSLYYRTSQVVSLNNFKMVRSELEFYIFTYYKDLVCLKSQLIFFNENLWNGKFYKSKKLSAPMIARSKRWEMWSK